MFKINDIFSNEITKITGSLLPPNFTGTALEIKTVRGQVSKIIDRLGRDSAKIQCLSKVVTSTEKLMANDSCAIYILKDAKANNGDGETVGMIKIGKKHLYLSDSTARVHQIEPWCVLDFYVDTKYQRHGLGKQLMDYMLADIGTSVNNLAIDGPSEPMLRFLGKNYGINNIETQPNNFGITKDFFNHLDEIRAASDATTLPVTPSGAGRFTAAQPRSSISGVIHGGRPGGALSSPVRYDRPKINGAECHRYF